MSTRVEALLQRRRRDRDARQLAKSTARASSEGNASRREALIARRGHLVHKLKAKDTTGRWAYYFVYVPASKEKAFLRAIEGDGTMDLEDYGKIIGSCYGDSPSEFLKQELREKYRFEV